MAAQKLFSDFPKNVSGMPGMVTPAITSDIFQKSEEDDPNTLAGYKKRLELQAAQQEAASRSKVLWSKQMQDQWEQEAQKKQAEEMRQLDKQKREAFNVIYRPEAEAGIRKAQEDQMTQAGLGSQQIMNQTSMRGKPGVMEGPIKGSIRIPGFGIVGPPMGGPQPAQVQQAINTMYGRNALAQQAGNTNPYYRNPYL